MTAIRKPGKVNQDTTLIDFGTFDVTRGGAGYLIQARKSCLIDGGTRSGANRIIRNLKKLDTFPDIIIITHPHWDHCQAIPAFRRQAARMGKEIKVMASEKAIPLLEDQSWNIPGCENITGIVALKQGDIVDLGGIALQIFDAPGHCTGHIAIFDQKNRNIFVGDAIGCKFGDNAFFPAFFPPFWDSDSFCATINNLKQIEYDSLCLAHYGYIYDDEAKDILDEAIKSYKQWWKLFEKNVDRLDDINYMLQVIKKEIGLVPTDHELLSLKLKFSFGLVTIWNKLTRKRPQPVGEFLFREYITQLITAYKTNENLIVEKNQE